MTRMKSKLVSTSLSPATGSFCFVFATHPRRNPQHDITLCQIRKQKSSFLIVFTGARHVTVRSPGRSQEQHLPSLARHTCSLNNKYLYSSFNAHGNIHSCSEIEARVGFFLFASPSSSDDPFGVTVVVFRVHDLQGRRVVERLLH